MVTTPGVCGYDDIVIGAAAVFAIFNLPFSVGSYESFFGAANGVDTLRFLTISSTTAVPEPGTLALLWLGLLGVGYLRRRSA
jgi:hypothetical protein